MTEQSVDRGLTRPGAAGLGISAALVALAARAPWLEVSYFDDRVGGGVREVTGAQWSTEALAVALLLVAGGVATLALRRLPRRIVAAVVAVAAAFAALSPLGLIARGADVERVRALLTAGAGEAQSAGRGADNALSPLAQIVSVDVNVGYAALAVVGCAVAVASGLAVALRPGSDSRRVNKYEKESVRREKIGADLEDDPDSGRVMWDAIDADIDPTDPQGGPISAER
ncbi:TIGR02234 family membrane protein [Corynebacterium liangguodongii]|uniref:TIGR02234 family membrane protein n=1 Tax=Corynebacterium liangguodongii TaxID=2079535 RepID=A0A2S0WEU6_9CORY|nr:TIGR02234 family membrane protein [Corynebacterium liangguodongii]AWB84307.1 TIGR02234 family membrane protein [Corynebacterium liangguodongii]PWB99797.1 TIGR02234 family membrane protein [Corynebacterium liangguodongii]